MPERNEGGVRLMVAAPLKLGTRELRPGQVVLAGIETANDLIALGRALLDTSGATPNHDLRYSAA
ncbi:hypothetical protein ORIO_04245 [Cereibacter azotoformans]|uniref:hypothetical protein n=1 Tax=Cereibacter azotoformans TaxID=43057 RepID=UPI001EEB41BF|nr:hypothetical protein [Cereibacter azotoformans]ULB09138.1 hypothetical protein ORIO_04245 [Cereibacter azotoformans]